MTKAKPQQESWRESLHDMLIALIYRVGEEVTKDYKQKNGVWEGLSVSNEITRQKYQEKLEMLISTERQRVLEEVREVIKDRLRLPVDDVGELEDDLLQAIKKLKEKHE